MRKTIVFLTMLLLAVPAMAAVTVTCVDNGNGSASIYYDARGEAELVRAFGLDVEVDNGAKVSGVNSVNSDYYIYPGTIQITDGNVISWGSPVAPANDPGAKSGLGTGGVTLELGSLYAAGDGNLTPDPCGLLCTVKLSGKNVDCNMTVSTNVTRGGVVMEDTATPSVGPSNCQVTGLAAPCWGYTCFACGDTNGDCAATFADVSTIINGWPPNAYNPCADLNKDGSMTFADVSILINHWPPNVFCPSGQGCGPCTPI